MEGSFRFNNMKYIIAIDSFKGCLTSEEAAEAVYQNIASHYPKAEIITIPVSDGGEGMLNAFCKALKAKRETINVRDAMMRRITAEYGITDCGTAIIEVALSCGLTLIEPELRNPLIATSYGVGQLIASAIKKGCRKFIIGLGGSATCDCGIGMLKALIESFSNNGNFDDIRDIINECKFIIASDVTNPLCGPNGASNVFARQKGATESMIDILEKRAMKFAEISAMHIGHDYSNKAGAGAAGGLGYALMQYMNAEMKSGGDLLLDLIHFEDIAKDANIVITGEGTSDKQTLMGKLPYVIMRRAKNIDVPTLLIAGKINNKDKLINAGFKDAVCINPKGIDIKEAMKKDVAISNIRDFPLSI